MKYHSIAILWAALGLALSGGCKRQVATKSHVDANETQDSGQLKSCALGTIPNVHSLGDVYLAGQPKPEDFEVAKAEGIKTIINLRHAKEINDVDEEATVKAAGLDYVHLPWNGEGELTDDVIQRSRKLFETAERPILMHCGSANRVGALWIPWRVLDGNVSLEEAIDEAKTIGLKNEPNAALSDHSLPFEMERSYWL